LSAANIHIFPPLVEMPFALPPAPARPSGPGEAVSWRLAMQRAIRDPLTLCRMLRLPREFEAGAVRAARLFPLLAPLEYVRKMRAGDPRDPLLLQVLPLAEEEDCPTGFSSDPLHESAAEAAPGLLHKYQGRALMIATGACAVHCRYCFRRHYPYGEGPKTLAEWEPALLHISSDTSIEEVLLSGGDPLSLSDERLGELAQLLAEIPHVKRLRIHTRLPIVIPQRVCDELFAWLCGTRLTPVMIVHANHPRELDEDVAAALAELRRRGVMLFNQSVLLQGVNDDADVLAELSLRLIDLGVTPYYLHQLDRVAGAAHFEAPVERGMEMIEQLRRGLPGYAVPRYVRELPGESSKRLLM
jgi:EF-P beta-lysylation protein EpmB